MKIELNDQETAVILSSLSFTIVDPKESQSVPALRTLRDRIAIAAGLGDAAQELFNRFETGRSAFL